MNNYRKALQKLPLCNKYQKLDSIDHLDNKNNILNKTFSKNNNNLLLKKSFNSSLSPNKQNNININNKTMNDFD